MQQQRLALALFAFVLPFCFLDRLSSFSLLRLLAACGDSSFSSIYLWFIGRLNLFVRRMYWGVAEPSWFEGGSFLSDIESLYSCLIVACNCSQQIIVVLPGMLW